jgi:hypothetical protein
MKKILFAAAAMMLATSAFAAVGSYHKGALLFCTDCHTMHASRQHGNVTTGTGWTGTRPNGNDKLLVGADVNATCFSCHKDQTFAPDVYGPTAAAPSFTGGATTGNRAAGFISDMASVAADQNHGHTMGSNAAPPGWADPPWLNAGTGWNTAEAFNCTDCHGAHGSNGYRNLGNSYNGGRWADAVTVGGHGGQFKLNGILVSPDQSTAAYGNTAEVYLGAGQGTAGYYTAANVTYSNASGLTTGLGGNKFNLFCAQCHGMFHDQDTTKTGAVAVFEGANTYDGTNAAFTRHPTSGAINPTVGGGYALSRVTYGNLAIKPNFAAIDQTQYEPGCVTCHKGHGTANDYGLVFPAHGWNAAGAETLQDSTDFESGNGGSVRDLCTTCHSMGRR